MKKVKDLHRRAMEWADKAWLARIRGEPEKAPPFLKKALALERKAALLCPPRLEPTRSVLFRSAGTLALQCNRFCDAEQLAAAGLAGNPPEEIADELRALMKRIWRERKRGGVGTRGIS